VRVRLGTTHPAMARLFRSLFETHGPIYEYPHQSTLGFEWSLDCDLDSSFSFLLGLKEAASLMVAQEDLFLNFLAGFFDAEGSIYYHNKGKGGAFELSITNTNFGLLQEIANGLRAFGIAFKLEERRIEHQKAVESGIKNPGEFIWILKIWQHESVNRLLKIMDLRHPEKVAKAAIACRLEDWPTSERRRAVLSEWHTLLSSIESECEKWVERARVDWERRRSRSAGEVTNASA
jgi:hypothetical protein